MIALRRGDVFVGIGQERDTVEAGATIEPVAVAVHAWSRAGDVAGKKIVVLGAGPIVNLVIQVVKGLGTEAVMRAFEQ
ncbi:MAG: hypothetical protein GY801_36925 [bacterium]|nr:hypothetical protein [bacterium]